jgi:uncharacterized repeat protein (TIGR01451 family)
VSPSPPSVRRALAVVLLSVCVVVASRLKAQPSDQEVRKAWRHRLPEIYEERYQRRLDGEVPEQRYRPDGVPVPGAVQPFHAGGAEVCEPLPVNPLYEPLSVFDDETGEEPPETPISRYFFVDWDGDGDLDVFVGEKYGDLVEESSGLRYLENVGSETDPVYQELTGTDNPADGLDFTPPGDGSFPDDPLAPAVVDIDGDDDLDLFVGTGDKDADGRVLFFENVGGTLTRNDADNPFAPFVFGTGGATPFFIDWDDDEDLDVFVGSGNFMTSGADDVFFLRNVGDETNPIFSDETDTPADPFAGVVWEAPTAPAFADLDGDGDLDGFVGDAYFVRYFENTAGVFTELTGYANPLAGSVLIQPAPVFPDVDGDGDLDVFLGGGYYGSVHFIENTGTATDPQLLTTGNNVELFDFDGDGDLDAFSGIYLAVPGGDGEVEDRVAYFENVGTAAEPGWVLRSGTDNPFFAFNESVVDFFAAAPTLGDVDGDGLLEAFVGQYDSALEYLEHNPGTGQFEPGVHPLEAVDFGSEADPLLADLNGDGELDLVVGHYDDGDHYVSIFLNPPGPAGLDAPADAVLSFPDVDGPAQAVTAGDVDGDGDPDLILSISPYEIGLLPNTGDEMNPQFVAADLQPIQLLTDFLASPTLGDVNGDGLLDLYVGTYGSVQRFETEAVGVTATPDAGLVTDETGTSVQFTVVLDDMPSGPVVLDLASSDTGEGTVSPAQLSFDGTDWNVPQVVTLTGVDDPDADGPQPYQVVITRNAASEPICVATEVVSAVNLDDEAPILVAEKSIVGGDLVAGGSVVYQVVITNVGTAGQPDDPAAAELTDTLPAGLTLNGVTASSGTATISGNTVRFDGAIAAGDSVTLTIDAVIDGGTAGSEIVNQGTVFFDNDLDGDNDTEGATDDPSTPEEDDPTAFVVGAEPIPVTAIPTLSEWAAVLFGGLLSLFGLFGIRRQG